MDRPLHDVRINVRHTPNSRRAFALVVVGIIHIGLIYALAVGLATGVIQKGVEEIKVAVEKPKVEKLPPPPPPPDLAKPPPPVVPPPEIVIQQPAPQTAPHIETHAAPAAPAPQVAATGPRPRHARNCEGGYPPEARRLQQEGKVLVQFTVQADGSTTDVTAQGTSGSDLLDAAAVKCMQGWTWTPATAPGGGPIAKTMQMYVQYKLH